LFLGTVRDNRVIAAPSASDADLWEALAAVGGDWAGELPAGSKGARSSPSRTAALPTHVKVPNTGREIPVNGPFPANLLKRS
jgi:hypothetical protein